MQAKSFFSAALGSAFVFTSAFAQTTQDPFGPEDVFDPNAQGTRQTVISGPNATTQPAPAPTVGTGETSSTVTVSQTFVNDENTVTVIGTVTTEQEKQAIQTALQQAAPGKTINNQLRVAATAITEPAGAQPPATNQPPTGVEPSKPAPPEGAP